MDSLGGGPPPVGEDFEHWINNSSDGQTQYALAGSVFADGITPADFDGDGIVDKAIWATFSTGQPSGNAYFYIFRSSDSTTDIIDFGQQGDVANIVGDYDGDGMADPAVYRCPSLPAATGIEQCSFYYAGSSGSGISQVNFGAPNPVRPIPFHGDFDGDGTADFNVAVRNNAAATGLDSLVFWTLRSSDSGVTAVQWGLDGDNIVPGDYDGDGVSDLAIARAGASNYSWWVLSGADFATVIHEGVPFGNGQAFLTGGDNDWLAPGDYDGDGATDIGVFRSSPDPDQNIHYSLNSSDGALTSFEWGSNNDYPVANWQVGRGFTVR